MTWDLVIKNGTVIDPSQGLHAKRDIAIAGGKIRAVDEYVSDGDAHDVLEAGRIDRYPGSGRPSRPRLVGRCAPRG